MQSQKMRLEDIKPLDANMDYHRMAAEEFSEVFMDAQKGCVRSECLSENNCPVCAAEAVEELFQKQGLTFVRCKKCTHVFIHPYLKRGNF